MKIHEIMLSSFGESSKPNKIKKEERLNIEEYLNAYSSYASSSFESKYIQLSIRRNILINKGYGESHSQSIKIGARNIVRKIIDTIKKILRLIANKIRIFFSPTKLIKRYLHEAKKVRREFKDIISNHRHAATDFESEAKFIKTYKEVDGFIIVPDANEDSVTKNKNNLISKLNKSHNTIKELYRDVRMDDKINEDKLNELFAAKDIDDASIFNFDKGDKTAIQNTIKQLKSFKSEQYKAMVLELEFSRAINMIEINTELHETYINISKDLVALFNEYIKLLTQDDVNTNKSLLNKISIGLSNHMESLKLRIELIQSYKEVLPRLINEVREFIKKLKKYLNIEVEDTQTVNSNSTKQNHSPNAMNSDNIPDYQYDEYDANGVPYFGD